jgi:IS5 family transposase
MTGLDKVAIAERNPADKLVWLDMPMFSEDDVKLRADALADLTEHERVALRHRERWLHRRRATDQLKVR